METQKIKIAVVVLNWNGKVWLKKFLPTLVKYSNDATVFVVDNASTDDSISFLKQEYPEVNVILNKKNSGYAKGYNDGLSQISAEYFVLINSDIEVTENWLSPIIDLMEKEPCVAACQPKLLDYNNKKKFEYAGASGGFIDNLGYPFCRGRIFDKIEEDNGQYNDAVEVFWATGACLVVRASYFWEVGGLDEDFFAHQEEIDLCWRFKHKGYKVMVEPKAIVYHVGGGTLNANSSFKTHLNFRNNLCMLFKNLPLHSLFFVILIRLFLDGLAAFVFLKKSREIQHFLAIGTAHFSFYLSIPKLMIKRKKIKHKTNLEGKMNFSILIRNKLNRINRFSEL